MTSPTDRTAPTGQTAPLVPGDLFARHQTIAGLRALADFLEANPGVPVDEYGERYHVFTRDSDASSVALVDQTAELLGVEVTDDRPTGGHYTATKRFGRITYAIVHIPERNQRQALARDSYCRNIVLDTDHDQDENGGEDAGRAA
ncbi:hypothetical protein [Actinomadura bangladeshensis]|uniref:Uncharacterized protein n=1 Tax=Actinomadura bangladeshensis TaxID=453573 RepID=A0A6L9QS46_9ACTN|nr:hypothetical protein [Actinomadura bangladeshensis]NEA28325.1 hypothetical protein [Actinomadura bangladeshensis]